MARGIAEIKCSQEKLGLTQQQCDLAIVYFAKLYKAMHGPGKIIESFENFAMHCAALDNKILLRRINNLSFDFRAEAYKVLKISYTARANYAAQIQVICNALKMPEFETMTVIKYWKRIEKANLHNGHQQAGIFAGLIYYLFHNKFNQSMISEACCVSSVTLRTQCKTITSYFANS